MHMTYTMLAYKEIKTDVNIRQNMFLYGLNEVNRLLHYFELLSLSIQLAWRF